MSALVIDASVFGPYLFKGEWSEKAVSLLTEIGEHELYVPAHWHLEIANMLTAALHKDRISRDDRAFALASLERFVTIVDEGAAAGAWAETLDLADKYRLTLYDAAYLEIATRRGMKLASNDRALLAAALQEGVDTRTSLS